MRDIVIIGAGVIGCSIARELSKYEQDIVVLEKKQDVADATTKANSGIVHAGEDPSEGSLKALMNVKGNKMFEQLHQQLQFPFKRNGSLVLCFEESKKEELEQLRARGIRNGVPDTMRILNREEALQIEPHLGDGVVAALYLPTGGIVCPYEMTIALAENAHQNGVVFQLATEVTEIEKKEGYFDLTTNKGKIQAKIVINAAGIHADDINNQISKYKYNIVARRGEYILLDQGMKDLTTHTLFQLPTDKGKGILVTPTVSGNILVGPTANDIDSKEDVSTTKECLDEVMAKGKLSIKDIPTSSIITSFSGLRAHEERGDFVIEEAKDIENFINVLGIESPGLTSAPAIAEYVKELIASKHSLTKKKDFIATRESIKRFKEASDEERKKLIASDSRYGKIVCRCELVTEAEVIEAINRPLGAKTLDGIKKRTRAGMGRCQAGFCTSRLIEILSRELNIELEEVTKSGGNTNILIADIKEYLGKRC